MNASHTIYFISFKAISHCKMKIFSPFTTSINACSHLYSLKSRLV